MKLSVVCWLHYEFYFTGACFPIEDHVTFIPFTSTLYLCLSLVMAKFSRVLYYSYCTMKFTNLRCEWTLPPTLRENHAIALTNLHLYFYKCFEVVYFMLIVTTYVFSVGTLWPSDIVLLSSHKGRIVEPVSRSRSRSPRPRYDYFFLRGYDPDDMWGTASLNKIAWCFFLHGNNLGYGWFCSNSCELISLRIIVPNIKPGVRGYLVLTIFSTNVGVLNCLSNYFMMATMFIIELANLDVFFILHPSTQGWL